MAIPERHLGRSLAAGLLLAGACMPPGVWAQFGGYGSGQSTSLPPGGAQRDRMLGQPGESGTARPVSRFVPSVSAELVVTDNVDLTPDDDRRSDVLLVVRPSLLVDYNAARAYARGFVSLPTRLYARTGSDNNEVRPQVDLLGRLHVVENFFFVEAAANVQQTYSDPFGPRPLDFSSATDNEFTSQVYRVTPQINGRLGESTGYFLRNDNIWSRGNYSGTGSRNDYINRLLGTIEKQPAPFGFGADISREQYDFGDQPDSQVFELARLRATWQPDIRFRGYVSGGYEQNRMTLSDSDGAIYGAGFSWRPTDRTSLDAGWEERFFGGSYYLQFHHRTPLSVWSVSGTRNMMTYADEVVRLPQGSFVPGLLDEAFAARIPDPAERAQYIAEFIDARGLPLMMSNSLALYTQAVRLQESIRGTVGLLGVRNTVFVTAYYIKNEPLPGDDVALANPSFLDNRQRGGTVTWSYRLTPASSLTLSGAFVNTKANPAVSNEESDQWRLRLVYTRPISGNSTVFAGARYQELDSNIPDNDYRETAVFAGFNYTFR